LKIVVLGPDGAGKSSVIAGLAKDLESAGRAVEVRHLKPRAVARLCRRPITLVVDPHGKPPRGALFSLAKIVVWLCEEWYALLFHEKRRTLLIYDRYYHDLLIDPKRFRFGAPLWTARLIGRLMPKPRLWILLDAPAAVLRSRKQEVTWEETARQCKAYREFLDTRSGAVILDATQPLTHVIADAARAIEGEVGKDSRLGE
jgi:thymidylate kinase